MPNEKKSRLGGDLVGAQGGARQLDHRADQVLEPGRLLGPDALGQLAQPAQLLARSATSGCMISTSGASPVRSSTARAARAIARTCIS